MRRHPAGRSGAENVSKGTAVAPSSIDIGGMALAVAGAPLTSGPVGWAVRPDAIRIVAQAGIPAGIVHVEPPRAGLRAIVVRVGCATLQAVADTASEIRRGPCLVTIDPGAVQVWPAPELAET